MIHGIDVAKIRDCEEKTGGLLTHWLVLLPSRVDVLLSDSGNLLFLLDLGGLFLGCGKDVDGFLILQDVLIRRQHLQDLLLNLKQLLLIRRTFKDQSLLLLLEIWSFLLDNNAQELIIESLIGDHEVYDGDFSRDLGEIVRISVFGSQVEGKLVGVFDDLVS